MELVLEIWQTQGFENERRCFSWASTWTAEGVRMKGVVWITEGTSLVRCVRSLSEPEKRLCSIADTRSHQFPRPCQTFTTQHVP